MKAKSIKGNSTEEIRVALQQSMADGYKPTLAIVFISIKQDIKAVCEILDHQDISIFGATSSGEFIDEEISKDGIVILLMDMKKSNFSIMMQSYEGREMEEVARTMGLEALKHFENPSFLICNSMVIQKRFIDGRSLIDGLECAVGNHITIWGGNAGDDRIYDHTVVFTNKQTFDAGVLLLVLNADNIAMKGMAGYGWKPAGTERTITRCEENMIYTIDGKPALDVVFKLLGLQLTKEDSEKFKPGNVIFCVARQEGAPVMRASGYFNWDEKCISVLGDIQQGDKFRFALPPDFDIVEQVTKDAQQVKENDFPDADAMVMFSCIARLEELGPMVSIEIEGVKNSFNVPMAGYFSYGEFGRSTNGKNEFHNNTCCWVALKEIQ